MSEKKKKGRKKEIRVKRGGKSEEMKGIEQQENRGKIPFLSFLVYMTAKKVRKNREEFNGEGGGDCSWWPLHIPLL